MFDFLVTAVRKLGVKREDLDREIKESGQTKKVKYEGRKCDWRIKYI
jgi:hypothetical protein